MAPEDKATSLSVPSWEAMKGPSTPPASKHVLLAHQLQADSEHDKADASPSCVPAAVEHVLDSAADPKESDEQFTLPPPPPLLSLQPLDAASLLPIPSLHACKVPDDAASQRRKGYSTSESDDEDEANLSKKELRMRRNRESAARSRKRKRDEVEALTGRVTKLNEENAQQRKLIESLRQTIEGYRQRFGKLEGEEVSA